MPEVVLSSEPSPTQPFGSGQPTNEAQDSSGLSEAKIEPVLSLEPLLDKGLSAQDKTNQRKDPIFETDAQQTIFPAQSAPASNQERLVPKPGVAPKVGDAVMTPLGQGIVRMTYPDGQFGVDLEGGRSFSAWSASEITVLGFG